MDCGLGFRAYRTGSTVESFGFSGLGFRVLESGFEIKGFSFDSGL